MSYGSLSEPPTPHSRSQTGTLRTYCADRRQVESISRVGLRRRSRAVPRLVRSLQPPSARGIRPEFDMNDSQQEKAPRFPIRRVPKQSQNGRNSVIWKLCERRSSETTKGRNVKHLSHSGKFSHAYGHRPPSVYLVQPAAMSELTKGIEAITGEVPLLALTIANGC